MSSFIPSNWWKLGFQKRYETLEKEKAIGGEVTRSVTYHLSPFFFLFSSHSSAFFFFFSLRKDRVGLDHKRCWLWNAPSLFLKACGIFLKYLFFPFLPYFEQSTASEFCSDVLDVFLSRSPGQTSGLTDPFCYLPMKIILWTSIIAYRILFHLKNVCILTLVDILDFGGIGRYF